VYATSRFSSRLNYFCSIIPRPISPQHLCFRANLLNHQGIQGSGLQAHRRNHSSWPLNMPSRWCWSSASTSATAAMVDPSVAWDAVFARRRPRLDRLGASLPIWEATSAAAGRGHHSTSPQCLPSPPSSSTCRRQQRCATWWRGSTPSGEPVGELGLLLSAVVAGVEEGVLRRCRATFRSLSPRRPPPPVRGTVTPLLPSETQARRLLCNRLRGYWQKCDILERGLDYGLIQKS
jgi:hypothetical protein